jgi:adenosylcobyric acid synthase
VLPDCLCSAVGQVLGVDLHGLFEQPAFVRALLGAAPERTLDDAFEGLADAVEAHLDVDAMLEAARCR